MAQPARIMIACGGTSGHVNPAIAIATEMRRRHPDTKFLFVGTEKAREADLVPRAGFDMTFIDITGISRARSVKALEHNVETLHKFRVAVSRVKDVMRDFQPDVVLGTGGYVSAPVLEAASQMHVKIVLHEQNAFAGLVTKLFCKRAEKIYLSFPLAKPLHVPKEKTVLAGNPVVRDFGAVDRAAAREKLGIPQNATFVLSYGGSLGARKLNECVCDMLRLSASEGLMTHVHSAGNGLDTVRENLGDLCQNKDISVVSYIYDMPLMMAAADVVVARSGAGTVAELEAAGRASVLIPSPNVTENHQYFNARTLTDAGAGILCEEKDLTGAYLYELVKSVVFDATKKSAMERAARDAFRPDTLDVICDGLETLLP